MVSKKKTMKTIGLVAAAGFSTLFLTGAGAADEGRVIYGEDNRLDVKDESNEMMVRLSKSTAALVETSKIQLHPTNDSKRLLPTKTFKESYGLCDDEPFGEQPNAAFCSGFLVGEDIFVTAGHCITSESDCANTSFVFGFDLDEEGRNPTEINKKDVYTCASIIAREQTSSTLNDFAVIKLDRKVVDRAPLEFRKEGKIEVGEELTVIGHPAGIPTKIAGGAAVRNSEADKYFVANLDTYGGNSGSAVFNTTTGEVEGILVRGENDFVRRGECRVSNVCGNDDCRGEDVTRATEFAPYVTDSTDIPDEVTSIVIDLQNVDTDIPDEDSEGITFEFEIEEDSVVNDVSVLFGITHPFSGDIKLSLRHPDGTTVVIRNRDGGSEDDINAEYGRTGIVSPALRSLRSKPSLGIWKLNIADLTGSDVGKVNHLKLTVDVPAH